jgi:hypothetical protein
MTSHLEGVSMRKLLFALTLVAASVAVTPAASAQSFQGKVWFVSVADASNVTFPAPSAQEDVDFSTNGIAYIGQGTASGPESCITIGSFLSTCSTPTVPPGVANGLHFTGVLNPNLGNKAATKGTAINKTSYGEIIEFTGTLNLTNGQQIQILHDDGVALEIDGAPVSGFDSSVTEPVLESVTFAGITGAHSIDLLYANTAGNRSDGAWLLFFPKLF